MRRWREEHGSAVVELVGLLPLLVIAAFVAVQLQLFASTGTAAEHAARNAGRVVRDGGDAYGAARAALDPGQAAHLRPQDVQVNGEQVTVQLRVPFVVPGIRMDAMRVTRTAVFPQG